MEDLQGIGLLAGAQELDRDAGDGGDAQRGAAAGIAIDLGQDEAGDGHRRDERLGDADGLLAGHGIDHEKRLDRLDRGIDRSDLGHQGLVDAETARGVEDDHVADLAARGLHALTGDVRDGRADRRAVDRDVELLAEGLELIGGRRAIRVRGDEERPAPLLDDVAGELGRARRLARALQADHGDDGRAAAQVEDAVALAQELHELVVDDLDDLLAGGQRLQDVLPDGLLADAGHEVLDDLEVDVRLEQRQPDLAHGGIHVGLADPTPAGQVVEGRSQALAEGIEHGPLRTPSGGWTGRRGGWGRARPGGARVLTHRGGLSVAQGPDGRR
jgi:hypothetical protein